MRYSDASQMRYPDASKAWDPRAKTPQSFNTGNWQAPAASSNTSSAAPITNAGSHFSWADFSAAQSGKLPPPANAAAAAGNSPLNVPQAAMVVGEPIPIVFGRRRGTVGGVLIFPKATEARFENNSTTVTSRYHLVICDGRLPDIQRRDVRLGECRIGTFSQFYNARAGSWTPGNFATAQTAYTVPTFPTYTGGGGNYQGLSTFEAGNTFTGGSDDWKTAWNIFIRGGMIIERGRLLDATVDSSDNLADLILWALQRSGRVPAAMIDLTSLASAALFLETVGLWCNGEFDASGNLGDWLIKILPDFLLRETKVSGKFGLRPLLPVTSGAINTGAITPEWVLTESAIIPDSYQVDYAEAASRRPVAMAMLWCQQADDTDVPIVRTLTVGDQNASGPVEQHDLSQYATTENHAAKVGAYLYARRTLSTHTATVRLKPGNQTGTIAQGDIVQLYLAVETSREAVGKINRFYQVESIGHSLSGEETLSLSHFPVNSSGQSLIALAVANATAPGTTLSSNRTGGSCDIAGASTSTTVPTKSTSGTPISGQATGGGASSTYWAATGQFIDLFGGGTVTGNGSIGGLPIDSPPGTAGVPVATGPSNPLPHETDVPGEVPRAGVGLVPNAGFCGGDPSTIKWYADGVLLSTHTFPVGGGSPLITYEAPGIQKPSWLGMLTEGVLLVKVGDAGVTYTSEVTCTNGTKQTRKTLIESTGLLSRNYSVTFTGHTSGGPATSYQQPGYLTVETNGRHRVYVNSFAGGYSVAASSVTTPIVNVTNTVI